MEIPARFSCWRITEASSSPLQPGMLRSSRINSGENSSSRSRATIGSVIAVVIIPAPRNTTSTNPAIDGSSSITITR